ncbi:hypothetical protein NC99_23730 [Sunxiuqinia dokdonensis]|uniref:Uncharacterized protein n=1 Tax=Sunxiuqinia dokdonensis TaxID=1409788 RepID=A0A0L8V8Q4_9BACT|nr:hypothetical protein NC99_23730 [Sunxiuqinia dokdonensis]
MFCFFHFAQFYFNPRSLFFISNYSLSISYRSLRISCVDLSVVLLPF